MHRRGLALCALVAATLFALSGAAGGGKNGDVAFSYSPQSGPPGTVITVSGSGCATEVDLQVRVVLSAQGADGTVIATVVSAVIPASNEGEGGNWTVMITVPLGTPPGTYDLEAFCFDPRDGGGELGTASVNPPTGTVGFITYTLATFVIPTTPTTTTPAPAPVPTAEPTPVPGAPPAPMVAATPRTAG